jgi:hypothetical protein
MSLREHSRPGLGIIEPCLLADEMKEAEPKEIMLRITADYEKLAEWAEKLCTLVGQKSECEQVGASLDCPNRIRGLSAQLSVKLVAYIFPMAVCRRDRALP